MQFDGYAPSKKKFATIPGTIAKLLRLRQLYHFLQRALPAHGLIRALALHLLSWLIARSNAAKRDSSLETKATSAHPSHAAAAPAQDLNTNNKLMRIGTDLLTHTLYFLNDRSRRCCFAVCRGMLPVSRVDGLWKLAAENVREKVCSCS